MTDHSNEIDPAERIRQLQARRAASGRAPRPTAGARNAPADAGSAATVAAPRSPRAKSRRRHPAAATRWLLGGLSIVSFVGIAGAVAAANPPPTTASAPATASNGTAAPAPAAVSSKATSATSAGAATRVAHTTTRGS